MTSSPRTWTFVTHHSLVLSYIYQNPTSTARAIAEYIGVTERTTHKIISDLEREGYLDKRKEGRRNVYSVNPDMPLRHPVNKEAGVTISDLLEALTSRDPEIMEPPQPQSEGEG